MGEAKQEEAKAETKPEEKKEEKPAEETKEEKPAEEKKEEKPAEEKKEAAEPGPPPPIVLFVELHCVGCANKVRRSIIKCTGVEEVEMDMAQNTVTVKGVAVDPQALCSRIQKKTMRSAKVLSPLPPADVEATNAEAPPPQTLKLPHGDLEKKYVSAHPAGPHFNLTQSPIRCYCVAVNRCAVPGKTKLLHCDLKVPGAAKVELLVNMHCEACAQQLRRKILKLTGVQAVETDLATRKVTVIGTMDADKLVKYIHRRTGKLAKVIPPPPPPPKEEEKKEEEKKPEEEKPAEEKKEEKAEEKAPEAQATADGDKGDQKKEGEGEAPVVNITEEDIAKKLAYMYSGGLINYSPVPGPSMMNYGPMYGPSMMNYGPGMMNYGHGAGPMYEEEMGKRMVPWMPMYIVDRPPPPPQMFSDENPNACSIS